ncbi:hypothetical protein PG995_005588 [Apiospora arundinis]
MDQVIVQVFTAEIMVVEYRFGPYINQASNAYKLIRDTYDPGNVAIAFGRDPYKVVVKLFIAKVMIVEYRFGSYLNQAATAFHILRTSYTMAEVASVYMRDPCEPVKDDQLPYRQFPEHRQTLKPILDEAVQHKDSSASPTRVTSFHREDIFTFGY